MELKSVPIYRGRGYLGTVRKTSYDELLLFEAVLGSTGVFQSGRSSIGKALWFGGRFPEVSVFGGGATSILSK